MNISSVSYCRDIVLVTLRNVPCDSRIIGELLTAISEGGVNIDMISQTAPLGGAISVAFTVAQESVNALMPLVNGFKADYPELNMELAPGMTKLNFYDADMVNTPGVAAHVFTTLAGIRVNMITTSTVDISLLVPSHQEDEALALCRDAYGIEPAELPFE